MKQDRFLTWILVGIGFLIVAALVIFFTRENKQSYLPDDTPEGVVHDYVLAVINKDYQRAYSYLADLENKPTFEQFRRSFATGGLNPSNAGIKIGRSEITSEDATVEISIIYSSGDPFSSGSNPVGTANLLRQNGIWKLSSMPAYTVWDFSWYQSPPK